jgi:hypothetical protein
LVYQYAVINAPLSKVLLLFITSGKFHAAGESVLMPHTILKKCAEE